MKRRLEPYALVIPAGLVLGLVVLLATSDGLRTARGGRIGGDFPAFYGAARIVGSEAPSRLYDWQAQRDAERDLLPPSEDGWVPYAYPPFVAIAYLPLTLLSFKAAYAVHTIVMILCCAVAMLLLSRAVPQLRGRRMLAVAAALGFYPIFRAVLGGQNTAVSLLCAAGAAAALAEDGAFTAGLWMGAWLFKPQLALPVAALLMLRTTHRARFVAGVALVAGVYYLLAATAGGVAWPLWWWQAGAVPFSAMARVADQSHAISLPEMAAGFGMPLAGWLAALAIAGIVVWQVVQRRAEPIDLVAIASAAAVLMAPHALYYDAGLAFLGLALWVARKPRWLPVAAALYLLAWAQPLRGALPVPPLTIAAIATLGLCLRGLYISGTSSYSPQTSRSASHISPTVA